MTPEEHVALRAPFPDHAIGQLPKPKARDAPKGQCNECGGWHGLPAVHLDYVGHAAATDRLLTVDPSWTWEPFALNDAGLPALDRDGNLWIRLTVAGVTRPGVGDGGSMKERIGDAIRNAAMRFGVALDLWAKEDLHDSRQASEASEGVAPIARKPKPKAKAAPTPPTDVPPPPARRKASDPQTAKAMAMFSERGIKDRGRRLIYTARVVGRDIGSWNDLTPAERRAVIDDLAKWDPIDGEPLPPKDAA